MKMLKGKMVQIPNRSYPGRVYSKELLEKHQKYLYQERWFDWIQDRLPEDIKENSLKHTLKVLDILKNNEVSFSFMAHDGFRYAIRESGEYETVSDQEFQSGEDKKSEYFAESSRFYSREDFKSHLKKNKHFFYFYSFPAHGRLRIRGLFVGY